MLTVFRSILAWRIFFLFLFFLRFLPTHLVRSERLGFVRYVYILLYMVILFCRFRCLGSLDVHHNQEGIVA